MIVEDMIHGVKSFVDTVSTHEGADLPWYITACLLCDQHRLAVLCDVCRCGGGDGKRVEIDADMVLRMLGGGDSGDSSEEGEEEEEEGEEGELRELMEQMDRDLEAAGFKSSVREGEGGGGDLGLAHSLLSSLAAQPEAAGPTSNILHSLGIPVPDPD